MHCILSSQPQEKAKNIGKEIAALLDGVPQRLASMFKGGVIQKGEYGKFAAALEREFDDLPARPKIKEFITKVCCTPKAYGIEHDYLAVKYLFSKVMECVSSKGLEEAIRKAIGEDLTQAIAHVEGSSPGFPHGYVPPY